MLFRLVYDDALAQAAYLIGCQQTGEAIVIDPERDVDRYIELAAAQDLEIVAAAETHIHADFLSGVRELAERVGATAYVSDEGDADWKYGWLHARRDGGTYEHRLLRDGDVFRVGHIEFRAVHTPGHTPEHLAYVVTDRGGGADVPIGILTGDFVFVGDLGRPDLLETAAGMTGKKEASAEALDDSARSFLELPDYLQVWPAHGAGSACGKALGAVPQSTVGYEKRFNPALRLAPDREAFVRYVLEGQPEPPLYFGRMKVLNRDGVPLLGELPRPREIPAANLPGPDDRGRVVVDTRPWDAFRAGHVPGSLYAPLGGSFLGIVGSYVRPEDEIILIVEPARREQAVRALVRIGLDNITGFVPPDALERSDIERSTAPEIDVAELGRRWEAGDGVVLDVRRASEHAAGAIRGAHNIAHTRLLDRIDEIPRDRPLLVHCRSGGRSAYATAMLRRAGFDAVNVAGGMLAWEQAGGETIKREPAPVG